MFTGIIKDVAEVKDLTRTGSTSRLEIQTLMDVSDVHPGDSIAINGVCLTLTSKELKKAAILKFDIGPETLQCTSLGALRVGEKIHAEKAMQLSDRINGHLVQGHVDGIGSIAHRQMLGDTLLLGISAPPHVLRVSVRKGSIAVDGVSLTINKIRDECIELCLIPHTLLLTNFRAYEIGRNVNLESDMFGKYIYEFLHNRQSDNSDLSWDYLAKNGFNNDSKFGNPQ